MTRAVSPVIGTVLLVSITVVLAGVVTASIGGTAVPDTEPTSASITADASPDGRIVLTHEGGEPIDVRNVSVRVSVQDTRLAHQPPIPFFSSTGFEPGPTGPFNSAADSRWSVGEQGSFTISDTNTPVPKPGDEVVLEFYRGDRPLTTVRTSIPRDESE